MSQSKHPALRFVGPLKDLAEGRMEPDDWLAWWKAHAGEVEVDCSRGWFLRLKPRNLESGVNRAAWGSQLGAFVVLEALGVSFAPSDRYERAWNEDFERFCEAAEAREKLRAKEYQPKIAALAVAFPKFARFLKKRAGDIVEFEEAAGESDIVAIEQAIEMPLPLAYRKFVKCTRALHLDDGLAIRLDQVFPHPAVVGRQPECAETICIGEYWLEADGDQVLLEYSPQLSDDPPVYYYAHSAGTNTARRIASSFTAWIESLPRSPMFQES